MAAMVLCKRLVSRPNLHRSLCHASYPMPTKTKIPAGDSFDRPNPDRSLWEAISSYPMPSERMIRADGSFFDRPNVRRSICRAIKTGVPCHDLLNEARPSDYDMELRVTNGYYNWWNDPFGRGCDFSGDIANPALMKLMDEIDLPVYDGDGLEFRVVNICHRGVNPRAIRMIVGRLYPTAIADCNYSLKCLVRNRKSRMLFRPFLALMLVHGAIPHISTFSILIQSYCKYLKYQDVLDLVFTQMKAVGVEADACFYKCLMDGVCARFKPCYSYQLLERLISHRIQVPLSCYDAVVGQLCQTKMIDDISQIDALVHVLVKMKQQLVFPDEEIYICLLRCFYDGIDGVDDIGYINFLKCVSLGRLMFAEGIRVGALSHATSLPYGD